MPIIAQLTTMKEQTRCLQLETYLWLYFGILGYYICGTDVLTAINRANVNVSSDRHLWHDFVRRYNLYLDKVTTVFIDFERISR